MIVVLKTWTGLIVLTMLVVRCVSVRQQTPLGIVFTIRNTGNFLEFITILMSFMVSLSQIRAGHLSGDCHYKRELLRGFVKIRGHEQVSSL